MWVFRQQNGEAIMQGKNDLLCTQMKAGGTVHTTPLPEWAALSV